MDKFNRPDGVFFSKNHKLNESIRIMKEEQIRKEKEKEEAEKNKIRTFKNPDIKRIKDEKLKREKAFKYMKESATIGLTEMVSQLVERSLLIDVDKYAEYRPDYKADIRDTVKTILETANIQDTTKAETRALLEHVAKNTPGVEFGVHLNENEVAEIVVKKMDKDIEDTFERLTGEVTEKVVAIVSDEQKNSKELEKALKKVEKIVEPKLTEIKTGVIEALAVNDAAQNLKEHGVYDPEMSIANGILYVTILEALEATELVSEEDIEEVYADIKEKLQTPEEKIILTKDEMLVDEVPAEEVELEIESEEALEELNDLIEE